MCTIQRNILDARRWLCLFLVCAFVLCGIGGIHQRAQALVGVDDALVAIVIAGLAAMGITFASTGTYSSLSEYAGSLLGEYAESRGLTPAGLFTGVQSGANNVGQLLLNNRFVVMIEGFASWLISKYSLVNSSQVVLQQPGANVGQFQAYALPVYLLRPRSDVYTSSYAIDVLMATAPVYAIAHYTNNNHTSVSFVFYAKEAAQCNTFNYNPNTGTMTARGSPFNLNYNENYGGYISYGTSGSYTIYTNNNSGIDFSGMYIYNSVNDVLSGLSENHEIDLNNIGVNLNTGTIALPSQDQDYDSGDGAIVDIGAPWGMTYPDIVNRWIPKEWAPGQTGSPTLTYDAAPAIDEQVQTGPETAQVSSDPGEYAVPGLQSVFPFCIPFDIYNLLSALAADPVAPSFTWRFYVPRVCDETFTVDLSPFDTVAQIVRTVELLAFIVGLAMVTRERFLRG